MSASDVLFTTNGPVAFVTLDRPEAGNALTWSMYDALTQTCDRVDRDERLRVMVIRAAGEAFSTGTDIRQFADFTSGEDGLLYEARLEACLHRIERVAVPTIAQVQGIAAGAGCAIALACDLRVCTPGASFGVPIARTLGNGLSATNCARLVDHLGVSRTKDLLLSGRFLDAAEAAEIGLIARLVESEEIDRTVEVLTGTIAENAPTTLRTLKETLRQLTLRRRPDADALDDLIRECYSSDDFREGVEAFLAKRPPRFQGR